MQTREKNYVIHFLIVLIPPRIVPRDPRHPPLPCIAIGFYAAPLGGGTTHRIAAAYRHTGAIPTITLARRQIFLFHAINAATRTWNRSHSEPTIPLDSRRASRKGTVAAGLFAQPSSRKRYFCHYVYLHFTPPPTSSPRRPPLASSRGYAAEEALRTIPFSRIHARSGSPFVKISSHTNGFSILRGPSGCSSVMRDKLGNTRRSSSTIRGTGEFG